MENENAEPNETPTVQEDFAPAANDISDDDFSSDLKEPRWSVITFDERVAKNLSYNEAARKMDEFEKQNVAGLRVITDEAAERITNG